MDQMNMYTYQLHNLDHNNISMKSFLFQLSHHQKDHLIQWLHFF